MKRTALLVPVLLLAAAVALADYRSAYKDGVLALERNQYEKAAADFRQAIAENPSSGGRPVLIYGRRYLQYLPHWYLGLALYNLGDHRGAAEAWRTEREQGQIAGTPQEADLEKLWPEVQGAVAERPAEPKPDPAAAALAEAVPEAEAAVARATEAAAPVRELIGASDFVPVLETSPELQRDLQRAERRLQEARRGLEQGRAAEDPDALRAAAALADEVRREYAALLLQARQQQRGLQVAQRQEREAAERERAEAERRERADAERREAVLALRQDLTRLDGEGRRLLRRADQLEEPARELAGARRQLETLLGGVAAAEEDPEALRSLRDRIESTLASFQGTVTAALEAQDAAAAEQAQAAEARGVPPPALVNAAKAFFAADYQRTLELLEQIELREARGRVQVHLFRAAAGFTLYQLGHAEDPSLLERARQEVQALLELDPAFRPDTEFFSPRFVRFFEQAS